MIPKLPEEQFAAIGKIIVSYNNIELMLRYAFGCLIFEVDDGLVITELMHTSNTENLCAGIRYLLVRRCNEQAVSDFTMVEKKIDSVRTHRNKFAHSFVLNNMKTEEENFVKLQKGGVNKGKKSLGDFIKQESYNTSELESIVQEVDTTVQETIKFVMNLQEFIKDNFKIETTSITNFRVKRNE